MTATETPAVITEPCVIDGMPDDVYRADPIPGGSLSSSGVKKLLPPSCPAKYKHWLGKEEVKDAFDFGHAAHMRVLGRGKEFVVVEHSDWKTKAAREERDDIRASGRTPLLFDDGQRVEAMATALFEHPIAKVLLDPDSGLPEQSLFWQDKETSEWLRARVDFLRHPAPGKRLIMVDYKSARAADPERFSKAVWDYGYVVQAPFYMNGAKSLELDDDPVFAFVVQEVEPPYLVNVITLDANAIRIGNIRIRQGIDLYHACKVTDTWPGYGENVDVVSLPPYIERQFEDSL